MGHSCVRIKIRRRKVANLAAYSRQFTVNNSNKSISPKVEHKLYYDGDMKNAITCPFTKHKFIPTNPHPIPTKYGVSITGYDWVEPEGQLWKHEKHPQPKSLHKKQKEKVVSCKTSLSRTRLLPARKSEFPNYTLPKMNHVQYMEKLVEHKLAKWERKNPKPVQDLFEKVEDWEQQRSIAEERFRDFVVSTYDKLTIIGNIIDKKNHKIKAIKIGEIRDIDGKGRNVSYPNLSSNDKLYKDACIIAEKAMKTDKRILDADLLNHKHDQKRPLIINKQSIKKAA